MAKFYYKFPLDPLTVQGRTFQSKRYSPVVIDSKKVNTEIQDLLENGSLNPKQTDTLLVSQEIFNQAVNYALENKGDRFALGVLYRFYVGLNDEMNSLRPPTGKERIA